MLSSLMNRCEKWKLSKIAKRAVIQSENHTSNIEEYYAILVRAARKEFSEDNLVTLNDFLSELHQKALDNNGHTK